MTAGTIFLMWLGEQIDEYGIGNGISLSSWPASSPACRTRPATLFFEHGQFKQSVFTLGGTARGDISFEKLLVLVAPVRRGRGRRSSPSPRASGASRRSRPSTSAAGASTAAPGSSCR